MKKVGIIGCGKWGQNLARCFNELGALGAACDITPEGRDRARHVAQNMNLPVYDDYRRMLEDNEISGVVIATPPRLHCMMAADALAANKDVFVEKPMAMSVGGGYFLRDYVKEHGKIFLVGHVLEYHPAVIKILSVINQGIIGDVQYIYSNRLNSGTVRQEEDVLWSFAPHDIAVILRILGGRGPDAVSTFSGAYINKHIDDVTLTCLRFERGVSAHIFVSWLHPFKEQRMVIIGSRGMIVFDDVQKKLIHTDRETQSEKELVFSRVEPLKLECAAFQVAMTSRIQPLTDAESGIRVLHVLEAARESIRNGGKIVSMNQDV